MKIVTFNIRNQYNNDGKHGFIHRIGLIYDKISAEKPDVVAFQEMTDRHLELMEKCFPEYQFVGLIRNPDYVGEGLFVAVRRETCMVLGFESIFLSPTPYMPFSRYEMQSRHARVCVQVHLYHKPSKTEMRIFDLHLDHLPTEAKMLGMKDALAYIDSFAEKRALPYVLLGDFNVRPDSEEIALCNARTEMRDVTAHLESTFHKYGSASSKIDYIYLTNDLADRVTAVERWDDEDGGIWLSDHYPVCAELAL